MGAGGSTECIYNAEVREKCRPEEVCLRRFEPLACSDKFRQQSGYAVVAMRKHRADKTVDAGAMLLVLTIPNPLGVSTMSSEGMARSIASATTSRLHNILILLESVYPQMVLNVEVEVNVLITQSSARSRNSESFSSKGVSPLTEAMMLGI